VFSGRRSRSATVARITAAVVCLVLLMFLQVPGLVIGGILLGVVWVVTLDVGGGHSIGKWVQDKRRWRYRVTHGFDTFIPVDQMPDDLPALNAGSHADRADAKRIRNAYRDWPDGVTNLWWLESRPGLPAVAYHAATGETPYISVVFSVEGAIQGMHGNSFVDSVQEAFGDLMAGWGSAQKLVSGIQSLTRMIPGDSAFHEQWLQEQLDPDAPRVMQDDYVGLVNHLSGAFVPRSYMVAMWDVDDQFRSRAAQNVAGLDGWLWLVNGEIPGVQQRLVDAKYRNVHALSGPQLAAVLRHLQHPGWPIDRASDVTVDDCWWASKDERAWTEVHCEYPDPLNPTQLLPSVAWLHRTAVIPADALEVQEVDGLWLLPLLTGMDDRIIRTISTHVRFTPARDAKRRARRDATTDQRDLIEAERKGAMVDDETELALSASQRRVADLQSGGGHHGAYWASWITVSAVGDDNLGAACGTVEAAAADECGINRLDWFDTIQSAAHACTWPLGRGMSTPPKSVGTKVLRKINTATTKESIR
jgi:hypothetical protein